MPYILYRIIIYFYNTLKIMYNKNDNIHIYIFVFYVCRFFFLFFCVFHITDLLLRSPRGCPHPPHLTPADLPTPWGFQSLENYVICFLMKNA